MRAFFDSNVFVYALDNDDPVRQGVAQRLLAQHSSGGHALVLSIQVLLETYNVNEIDKDTVWLFQYTPKARVRGGGFEITIAKKTGEVVKVEHYQ